MVGPESLAAGASALSKASEISDYLEYWRQFKGKEVDVRTVDFSRDPTQRSETFIETRFITRGTVQDVLNTPPGFLLSDVQEIVQTRKLSRSHHSEGVTPTTTLDTPDRETRKVGEKFVSFSSIDELELTEVAEEADESVNDLGTDNSTRD